MYQKSFLVIISLFIATFAFAQGQSNETTQETGFEFERNIRLEKHSKEETITLSIVKDTKAMELKITSLVFAGKLTIEIYDSNNKKQGRFSVGTQLNIKDAETAKGKITKSLIEPEVGDWKIKIIPENADGQIKIQTMTYH